MSFPWRALSTLGEQIRRGEVVFFVGSGFSLDSENNSAGRLIRRLLIRLLAMDEALGGDWAERLVRSFGLSRKEGFLKEPAHAHKAVAMLAPRYYEVNEWFCAVFEELLSQSGVTEEKRRALRRADERWRIWLNEAAEKPWQREPVPLDEIDPKLWDFARERRDTYNRDCGKRLFLDTMGFRNPRVMAGEPNLDLREARRSYGGRLMPRHHVLARFAREGWCQTCITTNYDRLLEGAYRMNGFGVGTRCEEPAATGNGRAARATWLPSNEPAQLAAASINEFTVVHSPRSFIERGAAHRRAILAKIHGCAGVYAERCATEDRGPCEYLKQMVFTFREIQSWRNDPWARDFLQNLLRTRRVAFCGYSLMDQVIHDTFRGVYEEMRGVTARRDDGGTPEAKAWFFGDETVDTQFHGLEVLQAADAAVGRPAQSRQRVPDSYVRVKWKSGSPRSFPDYDDCLRWLGHECYRRAQLRCLEEQLQGIASHLQDEPVRPSSCRAVRVAFAAVWTAELELARSWDSPKRSDEARAVFATELDGAARWTEWFHSGLMREWATAQALGRSQNPGPRLRTLRSTPWYVPVNDHPDWAAWAAVLELALRNAARANFGDIPPEVALCPQPTVILRTELAGSHALTLRCRGFERDEKPVRLQGHTGQRWFLELPMGVFPWPRAARGNRNLPARRRNHIVECPAANEIWRWAQGDVSGSERYFRPAEAQEEQA